MKTSITALALFTQTRISRPELFMCMCQSVCVCMCPCVLHLNFSRDLYSGKFHVSVACPGSSYPHTCDPRKLVDAPTHSADVGRIRSGVGYLRLRCQAWDVELVSMAC